MSLPLVQTGGGGSSLATPVSLANGGTHADLSATGGASQVLKQVSSGADVTVAQLAFTDVSGSVADTQLPTPTTTTFGGVKDLAAVATKFVTSVVSGVPVAAQPATTDLSDLYTSVSADGGYFFGGGMHAGALNTAAASTLASTINEVRCFLFVLNYRITVAKAVFTVFTTDAGKVATFGIYNSAKNKVIDSGTYSMTVANTFSNTLGAAVTLVPGVYYFAWSSDGTAGKGPADWNMNTSGLTILQKNIAGRYAKSNQAMSGGVLPSSLGTLTAIATVGLPMCLFES